MLKVIICVEAHLYMMLHNEFEKIPNVISKSRREHNRITIKHEFRGEYKGLFHIKFMQYLVCSDPFLHGGPGIHKSIVDRRCKWRHQ